MKRSVVVSVALAAGLVIAAPGHAEGLATWAGKRLGIGRVGEALDRAHAKVKEAVPPYGALEEGVTHVVKEATVETLGPALAFALQQSRDNARRAGVDTIPDEIRDRLLCCYQARLLDKVRYRVGKGHELSVQANSIRFGGARAVTLIDTIVFASREDAEDDTLWAHEMKHIEQFDAWGTLDFAKKYVRSEGSVERPAYRMEEAYARLGNYGTEAFGVNVINGADEKVRVSVRPANGTWATTHMEPGHESIFYCDGCMPEFYVIRIVTPTRYGPRTVLYDLDPGERYAVDWNFDRGYWDVFLRRD